MDGVQLFQGYRATTRRQFTMAEIFMNVMLKQEYTYMTIKKLKVP